MHYEKANAVLNMTSKTISTLHTRFKQSGRESTAVWLCSQSYGLSLVGARDLVDRVMACRAAKVNATVPLV